MSESTAPTPAAPGEKTFLERLLDAIERGGNKMPHPAILFLALCGVVIVLSPEVDPVRRGIEDATGLDGTRGIVLDHLGRRRYALPSRSPSAREARLRSSASDHQRRSGLLSSSLSSNLRVGTPKPSP